MTEMSNIGRLYVEEELPSSFYVLLRTRLGFIALRLGDGSTYGGIQRTIAEATYGLQPTGYRLDLDRSCVSGRPYQDGTVTDSGRDG